MSLELANGPFIPYSGSVGGRPAVTPPTPAPSPPLPVSVVTADFGAVIPVSMGIRRPQPPHVLWCGAPYGDIEDLRVDALVSWGYNLDDDPATTEPTRLWANGSKIWEGSNILPGGWGFTFYPGTTDQEPDPTYEAAVGSTMAVAFRGQMYGSFTNFPLKYFNNNLPALHCEISGEVDVAVSEFTTLGTGLSADGNLIEMAGTSGVAHATGVQASALGSVSHTTGKYYLEFEISSIPPESTLQSTSFPQFGLAMTSHDEETPLSSGTTAFCVFRNGTFSLLGMALGSIAVGDRVGMAVDLDNHLVKARVNGGAFSSDVDYQTFRPTMVGAALVPGIGLWQADESATAFLAAADFDNPAPTGYEPWDGVPSGSGSGLSWTDAVLRVADWRGLDPDADFTVDASVNGTMDGMMLVENETYAEFLARHCRAYGYDFFEADTIRIVRPVLGTTYSIDRTLAADELLNDDDRGATIIRAEDDSPIQIDLHYIDQTQQFRENIQPARRILHPVRSTQSRRKDAVKISAVISANKAMSLAGGVLFREAGQNVTLSFETWPEHIDIEPGDLLNVTADNNAYDVKVTRIEIGDDFTVMIDAVTLFAEDDIELEGSSGTPLDSYEGGAAPANTVLPAITGTAYFGNTLTASTGTWSGSATITYSYQWKRAGVAISGATASTYVSTASDVGSTITVTVTATNAAGSDSATSAATAIIESAAINTVLPVISDTTPANGQSLTVTSGTWVAYPAATYTYQWRWDDAGLDIAGATSSTYVVQASDVGHTLEVWVTATNVHGAIVASSAATSAVAGTTGTPIGLLLALTKAS